MSVASIGVATATTAATAQTSVAHQRRLDFRALGKALQSGDLAGAQAAFADLTKLMQPGSSGATPPSAASSTATGSVNPAGGTTNPLQSDFNALAQALQSGDAKSAKSAFAQLMTDLKGLRGQHAGTQQAAAQASGTDADGDNDGSQGGSRGASQSASAPVQPGNLNLVA